VLWYYETIVPFATEEAKKMGKTLGGWVCWFIFLFVVDFFVPFMGYKPLGWRPGVWGFILCIILYVLVSLSTQAPVQKAQECIGYLEKELPKRNFM
jgi:Na+/proline symporter